MKRCASDRSSFWWYIGRRFRSVFSWASAVFICISLQPSFFGKPVDLQLADGLEAYPFGTHLTGIGVLHRVNIHQALGLGARLLDNLLGPVYRTQAGHPLPVFTGSKPRKQGPTDHFILPNHPEIHEKLFSGVKVGLVTS